MPALGAARRGRPLEEPRLDHNFVAIKNLNNYTGYTYDYVFDLYFTQNRFYNVDTRQFIQQDLMKWTSIAMHLQEKLWQNIMGVVI